MKFVVGDRVRFTEKALRDLNPVLRWLVRWWDRRRGGRVVEILGSTRVAVEWGNIGFAHSWDVADLEHSHN